ncbi:MAG TPA: PRD domain-containing protein [Candidatus Limnocylindrales bacterium]|nr:PRD domain-containing protein [Candidatus Limnocylindrales bacterium]
MPLDTRQARIARRLLETDGPASVDALATELKLTDRMVRYNLPSVDSVLAENGLRLIRQSGIGIWIEGSPAAREELLAALDRATGPAVLDPSDRRGRILLALLVASPDPIRSEALEERLGVSRPTIRRDMREAEGWLEQHRLHLHRMPGRGIAVAGSETDIRGGLLALLLEIVPIRSLLLPGGIDAGHDGTVARDRRQPGSPTAGIPAQTDVEAYLGSLDLQTFLAILRRELRDLADRDPTVTTAALSLAIAASRSRAGRQVRLGGGRLRSLLDHPVAESAASIAAAVEVASGVSFGRMDVAAITESLLGLTQLVDVAARPEAADVRYIDRIIAAAASRLHPSLGEDHQLRSSLSEHIRRLHVRLRFGLPISNPLQQEVRRRYPDVYRAASEILAEVGPVAGTEMPVEEIGLLTMYLAGSLERHRLRPKVRVTVVCPAGMATAWILVSRLVAEFPQIEVVRVVSKAAFETEPGQEPDLVISTIPLDDLPPASLGVVVSPLLREADVRRLGRLLGGLPS